MKLKYFVILIGFFLLQKRAFGKVNVQKYTIKTFVADRLAVTVEEVKVNNTLDHAENVSFAAFLPEKAYVSDFYITIDRKRYESIVTPKEKFKTSPKGVVYNFLSVRNSYKVGVDITVEANTEVIFHLEYEQLLQKVNGEYELVINISPGSLVPIMRVEVIFDRSDDPNVSTRPFMRAVDDFLLMPEVDLNSDTSVTTNNITVTVKLDLLTQLELLCRGLRNGFFEGLVGQLVVPFDLQMKDQGVTLTDGANFASFFSPAYIDPLPKHIVFVLDTSASMFGRRIAQLKQAMYSILQQLSPEDLFNLIEYDTSVYLWRIDDPDDTYRRPVVSGNTFHSYYGHLADSYLRYQYFTHAKATPDNINRAITAIKLMNPSGNTNSMGGLEFGLYLIKRVQEKFGHQYAPLMVFLTDGEPNVGISDKDWIIDMTTELNSGQYKAQIFSISLGSDVDWHFLRVLSLQNRARATKIELANDMAEQLEAFYDEINEPILGDIEFQNLPSGGNLTKTSFPGMFQRSELGVAGKGVSLRSKRISMSGKGRQEQVVIRAEVRSPVANLTRIWANLMLSQLTDQFYAAGEGRILHKATELSLEESMLTEFTSLVINLPEDERAIINLQNGLRTITAKKPLMPSFCSDLDGYMAEHYPYPITEEPELPTEEPEIFTKEHEKFTTEKPDLFSTEEPEMMTSEEPEDFTSEKPENSTIEGIEKSTFVDTGNTTLEDTENSTFGGTENFTFGGTENSTFEDTENSTFEDTENSTFEDTEKYTSENTENSTFEDNENSTVEDTENSTFEDTENSTFERPETVTKEEPDTTATKKTESTTADDFETFVTEEPETMITEGFKPTTAQTFEETTTEKSKRITTGKPKTTITKEDYDDVNDADGGDDDDRGDDDGKRDDPDPKTEICHLRPKRGTCNHSLKKWAFDGLRAKCISFQYTGCGGNEHRFATREICQKTCVHPKVSERCNLPISLGSCTKYSLKWFYSRRMRKCVEYEYGGCFGNDNRFDTEKECSDLCVSRFNHWKNRRY